MNKLVIFYALLLIIGVSISTKIFAQSETEEIVGATMTSSSQTAAPGETITLSVKLKLFEEAHANSNSPADPLLVPTVFTPTQTEGLQWGTIKYPKPTTALASYSVEPLSVFEDGATITVPVTIALSIKANQITAGGSLRIQVCDKYQCYPPKKIPLTTQIQITGGSVANPNPTVQPNNNTKTMPQTSGSTQSTGAVDFDFVDFSGKPRKFSEFRGKYVLIDFWATWCRPCLADIPKLKELYDKYKSSGFEILGMDAETLTGDEEEEAVDPEFAKEQHERAKQIVATRGVAWTQADSATSVPIAKKIFKVKALPTKILIDKEGKEIARIGEKDDLKGIVEKLLNSNK